LNGESEYIQEYLKDSSPNKSAFSGKPPSHEVIRPHYIGLALSGGGVRSAAFSMGAITSLQDFGVLRKITHMSTVSGGGFIGAALSWFLRPDSDLSRDQSQKGWKSILEFTGTRQSGQRTYPDWTDMGEYIRLNGDYLRPTPSLSNISLLAVVVRNAILQIMQFVIVSAAFIATVSVWFDPYVFPVDLASALRNGTMTFEALTKLRGIQNGWTILALSAWLLFLAFAIRYGLRTQNPFRADVATPPLGTSESESIYNRHYAERRSMQIALGLSLGLALLLTMLATGLWALGAVVGAGVHSLWFGVAAALSNLWAVLWMSYKVIAGGELSINTPGRYSVAFNLVAVAILASGLVVAEEIALQVVLPVLGVPAQDGWLRLIIFLVLTTAVVWTGYVTNASYSGVHRTYRDRLMEAFLPDRAALENERWEPATHSNVMSLWKLAQPSLGGPLHLLNCNAVFVNSDTPSYRSRGGDNVVLSSLYCGGDAINWFSTRHTGFCSNITLASAMAMSGAAINPHAADAGRGITRGRLVSSLLAITNLKLGVWMRNPRRPEKKDRKLSWWAKALDWVFARPGVLPVAVWQLIPELGYKEADPILELTDGGHFENTGAYELMRRECETIFLVDAGADDDYTFADIANLIERVRLDFGIRLSFHPGHTLQSMRPRVSNCGARATAPSSFAVADIHYPEKASHFLGTVGRLVIVKPCLLDGLPTEIWSHSEQSKAFPHTNTADQFFDESKFDAYRQLGYYTTKRMLIDCFGKGLLAGKHTTIGDFKSLGERSWIG
jgi:hypothetical protein